jgi:alkanesulfonate monooxygenase SsuD/methylene tetrahydromethanopterin reductase-like flavin-dependent oxidoreductase (luciferase family)
MHLTLIPLPSAPPQGRDRSGSGDTSPEPWLLGSSDYRARSPRSSACVSLSRISSAHGGDAVARAYRDRYQPSARDPKPRSLLCVFVICAKTRAEAERLAASIDLRRLHIAKDIDAAVPTSKKPRPTATHCRSARTSKSSARVALGDPGEVREKLLELKEKFAADEIMVVTITGDYESRRTSYRLVAEAFA